MKGLFLVFPFLLSISCFGQTDKIFKFKTSTSVVNDSLKSSYTFFQNHNIPLPTDEDLPYGNYKIFIKIENCRIKLLKDLIKDKRLSDKYLAELEIFLSKHKIEHYINEKLQPDCSQLPNSVYPLTIAIME